MRILLALALACIPVTLSATTLVIFRTPTSVILATDSAAVRQDGTGRHHMQVDCKIRQSGRWWFLLGGFLQDTDVDMRDWVADRLAGASTVTEALASIDDRSLHARISANRNLWSNRQAGSPLMTIVIAAKDLTVGVVIVSLKASDPFEVMAESGTCPGSLCPTGGYYLVGEPGDAPPNQLLRSLPDWFKAANGAAAREWIRRQIAFTPTLARPPIDVLQITQAGATWIDRDPASACKE